MQLVEVAHSSSSISSTFEAPMACRSTGRSSAFADRQCIMGTRVEILELVDPVQDIGNKLLEEDTGRHPDLAAQLPRHGVGQLRDVIVITQDLNAPEHRACWL